jgi:hypothetical protein
LAAEFTPAQAAWCNVFQVGLFRRRATVNYYYAAPAATSYYAPSDCCTPCPQPVCTTRYVQRCYYQPVVTYKTESRYEPVTTYRTSYFYEPVTSYSYSCYYDPCSCSYKQIATPVTSYKLKSQCCPVQSWVQRCYSVPVTTYQQSFYLEPVTSCCTPTSTAVATQPDCCSGGAPAGGSSRPPPGVSEPRSSNPAVSEPNRPGSDGLPFDRSYIPRQNVPLDGSSLQKPANGKFQPQKQAAPAPIHFDRVVRLQRPILD